MNNKNQSVRRVLIVDDDAQSSRMIDRALKKFWPELETALASDGVQAIQIAQEFLPELMILDLMLPGQDGFAVLDAMDQHPKLKYTLVLGITAYNSPENIINLMKRGVVSCLIKPFSPEALRGLLSPYMDPPAKPKQDKKEYKKVVTELRQSKELEDDDKRKIESVQAKDKKSKKTLLNAATFLSLMLSSFQFNGNLQASSAKLTKTTQIEEPYKKVALPFKRIAVLPFESWNEYLSGNTLSDYFVHNFIRKFPEVTVVERRELQKILKEQFFTQTGAVNPETVASIGKILGVDAILIGKITTLDTIIGNKGAISVVYRIVDVNTGKILWSDKQNAKMKPKLIQFESSYKNPMEVADYLLEQVAQKAIEQLQSSFSDLAQTQSPISNL